ncbi:MAG: 2-amino-4-hydroxy-6-hydroxymethyldihydropteridine diphosphokinase [Bacteroidales bacterium]|nr:2-amino-4-hydroxy-6-hydroxymethyldihydropteridine diphosphokinase [Bacteroidales bacterium]
MDEFVNATLLIGGNMGDSIELCKQATGLINKYLGNITSLSAFYCSEAWGFEAEQSFVNQAIIISAGLQPTELLDKALKIESMLGRTRGGEGYSPRTMDIDIIFYGNEIIDTPQLTIPHPRMHLRNFVLVPLCEIMPEFVHPVLGKTIEQLLRECPDNGEVKAINNVKK